MKNTTGWLDHWITVVEWVDIETGEKLTPNPEGYYIVKTIKKNEYELRKRKGTRKLTNLVRKANRQGRLW